MTRNGVVLGCVPTMAKTYLTSRFEEEDRHVAVGILADRGHARGDIDRDALLRDHVDELINLSCFGRGLGGRNHLEPDCGEEIFSSGLALSP